MKAEKGHQTVKINRLSHQLDLALDATGAHNPSVIWPVVRFLAPFVARIAIRAALRKMGRTASEDTIESSVQLVDGILERIKKRGVDIPAGARKKKK